ncbi:MAG: Holliday junction resolvase RuvX [Propionibacteriales bacterium]|nr:Holliday junction resolvase RuvX [Propionibacteriales bacterium]
MSGAQQFRRGVRVALDLGDARIGVAACDRDGTLAFPVVTIAAGEREVADILAVVDEYEPFELVVGLPTSLSGTDGPAATRIRVRAADLVTALGERDVTVRLVDERLTTTQATRQLRASGRKGRRQRSVIDQAAAVAILDHALTSERSTGRAPGDVVSAPAVNPEGDPAA